MRVIDLSALLVSLYKIVACAVFGLDMSEVRRLKLPVVSNNITAIMNSNPI